jgi:ketosteroid isomerase-like protein
MATGACLARTTVLFLLVLVGAGAACRSRSSADPQTTLAAVSRAHEAYVAAINSNKTDRWLASLTDDVELLVPNRPAIVGKAAVGAWTATYLQEVTTHWTKPVQGFIVSGEWAFGRYAYTASDSVVIHDPETEGGGTANDSGWGLIVYHHDADGAWRVARDAWASDRPAR